MFSVNFLVVEYKGEVLQVDGFKDSSDTMLLSFEDAVVDALKEDKKTLEILKKEFKYEADTSYLGETEIYHFVGEYGNLHIYTSSAELSTETIKNYTI